MSDDTIKVIGEAPKLSVGLLGATIEDFDNIPLRSVDSIRMEHIEKHILRIERVLKEQLGIDINDFPLDDV